MSASSEQQEEADNRQVSISSSESEYSYSDSLTLLITLLNQSEQPVYFDACGAIYLEELTSDGDLQDWRIRFLRCFAVTSLNPGADTTFTFTKMELDGYLENAILDSSVHYRFRFFPFYTDEALSSPLLQENQFSTEFSLIR